jgi:putative FmdB family regulatory protein
MPTYPYACTVCDHTFEVVQSFTDDALTVCPECSGRLRKVFGSVGVVFKGSGFYRTDSRQTAASSVGGSHGSNGSHGTHSGGKDGDKPAGTSTESSTNGKDTGGKAGKAAAPSGSTSSSKATASTGSSSSAA